MQNPSFSAEIPFRSSHDVRRYFLQFYESHGHQVQKSAPVVSENDPTTLFVNSGMMPLKSLFLGHSPHKVKRLCNSQKVLRVSGKHNDLDEVGLDDYHHTFFEMLGHWSFGDYFKEQTIRWGWELMTKVYQLPKERLFVTVHESDEEARELWLQCTDIAPHRVLSFAEENFWEMGNTGPCGPCSEIHFDRGDLRTQDSTYRHRQYGVNGTDHRYMELINFVFMALEKRADGRLQPLKQQHVDTGAGLERLCAIIQGVGSNYETDLFQPLITKITEIAGTPYERGPAGVAHRVISDHIRAVSFALCDGVDFAREGRGYVVRRILRRALRFSHELGFRQPTLYQLVPTLCSTMATAYPELTERGSSIADAIRSEEERFLSTLSTGLALLQKLCSQPAIQKHKVLPGEEIFTLYDTYGFPVDLTAQVAREQGIAMDLKGYERSMQEQKDRAKKAHRFALPQQNADATTVTFQPSAPASSEFVGHSTLELKQAATVSIRQQGPRYYCILSSTPFYPTSGGQAGDQGWLIHPTVTLRVLSTDYELSTIVHTCELAPEFSSTSTPDLQQLTHFDAKVDAQVRHQTAIHHTATHLLHAALRSQISTDITQRGSHLSSTGLRFDFSLPRSLSPTEITTVQNTVNDHIQRSLPVSVNHSSYKQARAAGALSLAGEHYADTVRVLTIGDHAQTSPQTEAVVSKELCGGTHVTNTSHLLSFVILTESAVASGTRRIHAIAGMAAYHYHHNLQAELKALYQGLSLPWKASLSPSDSYQPSSSPALQKLSSLLQQRTTLLEQAAKLRAYERQTFLTSLLRNLPAVPTQTASSPQSPQPHHCTVEALKDPPNKKELTELSEALNTSLKDRHAIVCLLAYHPLSPPPTPTDTKTSTPPSVPSSPPPSLNVQVHVLIGLSPSLLPHWHAGKLVTHICQLYGGSGGGKNTVARGGIKEFANSEQDTLQKHILSLIEQPSPPYKTKNED